MTHFSSDISNESKIYILESGELDPKFSDVSQHSALLSTIQKTVVIQRGSDVVVLCKSIADAEAVKDTVASHNSVGVYLQGDVKPKSLLWLTSLDFKNDFTCTIYSEVAKEVVEMLNTISFFKHACTSPANLMTPELFAKNIENKASENKISVEVLSLTDLVEQGFGGIVSVGQGSHKPPVVIVMRHKVPGAKKVLLVGKGITFDSGGLSLKRSDRMHEMKFDMTGGAEVASLALLAGACNLKLDLTVVIPAAENLPDGNATKPGDVIKLWNGKTVEIVNTDAEGRVVLADALAYGIKIAEPDLVIDIATLTSSAANALGTNITAFFSNSEDHVAKLEAAAKQVHEQVWRLPLFDGYKSDLKSPVADLQNIGRQKSDAIFAALFLQQFVGDKPWLHLDIAGTAWKDGQPSAQSFLTVWELLKNL